MGGRAEEGALTGWKKGIRRSVKIHKRGNGVRSGYRELLKGCLLRHKALRLSVKTIDGPTTSPGEASNVVRRKIG
jgi:hypothetical protein